MARDSCDCWQACAAHHVNLSLGSLSVLATWQLAGPNTYVGPSVNDNAEPLAQNLFRISRWSEKGTSVEPSEPRTLYDCVGHKPLIADDQSERHREAQEQPRQEPQSSCNLIPKVTSYYFCCSLFIKSKLLYSSHTYRVGITQEHKYQSATTDHLGSPVPQQPFIK